MGGSGKLLNIHHVCLGSVVLYKGRYEGVVVSHYHTHCTVQLNRWHYVDMNKHNLHHFIKLK